MGLLKSVQFWAKSVLALTIFSSCALYGVIASALLTLIGQRRYAQYTTARAFYYSFSTIMGVDIKLINGERLYDLPAVLVSNHQSGLDIFMLGRIFPPGCTVTAKRSLQYIPLLGWFMTLSGTFFLDRSNREKSVATLNKALQSLKAEKKGLFMFPEGTRSYSEVPTLLEFKKGAFHLAQQAGIPILPIVISNTSNILNVKKRVFNRGTIVIKVLDPVSMNIAKEDVGKVTNEVREKMLEEVNEIGYSLVKGQEVVEAVEVETEASNSGSERSESNVSKVKK